ncbi:hypothetical protein GETHLI_00140 [Geothrix limicola]|uniref:Uncharacterized protein n=1 Tax=Geothrix limicola TaxID=2927978 RepID=A0ABQ5Q9K4_9BACT|nr:hypothetical protein [Geothrix limicola]GLH71512.1 hypothetical protein GETHLI_00140 [Geothrix limicola]
MRSFLRTLVCLPAALGLIAQEPLPPIQVSVPEPRTLDLRQADAAALLPGEHRDPARLEAVARAWRPLLQPIDTAPGIRLLLPAGPERLQLLLAASQALRARNPKVRIYVAFQPELGPVMDELAWGAVDGGVLLPSDLGADGARWRGLLTQAQNAFPGRPWFLWVPADPGALTAQLLGDGGRLILPANGPGAALAQELPPGYTEVEGGLGDLTLRKGSGGAAYRRIFRDGTWVPAPLPADRHEVQVQGQELYDLGGLLARMRATQLRDKSAIRTAQATVDVNLHIQSEGGAGDLGFRFQGFEKVGTPEELLRKEVRFNGVRANLSESAQLPILESRTSAAPPIALTLTERYRYADGGPAGAGKRRVRFKPVDDDPLLFEGELTVDEGSGRILHEQSQRSNLPGLVRSERRELSYGEPAPGLWRVMRIHTAERWIVSGGTVQVLRDLEYRGFSINDAGYDEALASARAGQGSILQNTPDGYRYFVKQADGSRKLESKASSRVKGVGGMILIQPGGDPPVAPLGGYLFSDFNALDRGIQYSLFTAAVFNMGSLLVPRALLDLDLSLAGTLSLLGGTERPVKDGKQLDVDGVQRRSQNLELGLGHDLGAGFRVELKAQLTHDAFSDPREDKYKTQGFLNPPSGLTHLGGAALSWQYEGFHLQGSYLKGSRPEGSYGAPGAIQAVPNEGRLVRWDTRAMFDRQLGHGIWFSAHAGRAGGEGFDRFQPLSFEGRVSGIKPYAVVADRMTYGGFDVAFPTGPNLRLTLGLDHGQAHSLTDLKTYGFSGLKVAGDLPGFWWFTTIRVDLGAGLQSDVKGVKTVNGSIAFLHLF